jgi:hypothetical protein
MAAAAAHGEGGGERESSGRVSYHRGDAHVLVELLQVRLLLLDALLELEELLLLALPDGVVLVGLFALLERIAGRGGEGC